MAFKKEVILGLDRRIQEKMGQQYVVYISASSRNGILYIEYGSIKNKPVDGFTRTYRLDSLVYFEMVEDPGNGIRREKRLTF